MYSRHIFPELEKHLSNKLITVITGMRRVGKTTALKYLLDKIDSSNKIYLDLEKVEHRYLFNQPNYKEIEIGLQVEGIDFLSKAYIAIDEIQLVPNITSVVKYLYDTYSIKFIISGSSSFYIKNRFSESLAGRKRIFEMFPLSFNEILSIKGIKIPKRDSFPAFQVSVFNKLRPLYEDYLEFGGFPEVVLTNDKEEKKAYLKDIINAYLELDIKLLSDFTASDELYKLLRLLTSRTGSKTDYSKLSQTTGIAWQKIKDYLQLLEYTYFIKTVSPYTQSKDKEIALQKKIYFADNGLLNILSGKPNHALFENSIAIQLSLVGKVNYFAKKTGQEIDFILDNTIAIEVKETPTPGDYSVLERRAYSLGIKKYFLISRYAANSNFNNYIWGGEV
jgi:predicted AAA+ superfamily ATPase